MPLGHRGLRLRLQGHVILLLGPTRTLECSTSGAVGILFCEQRVNLAGWRRLHHGILPRTLEYSTSGAVGSSVFFVATRSERLALFVGFSFSSYQIARDGEGLRKRPTNTYANHTHHSIDGKRKMLECACTYMVVWFVVVTGWVITIHVHTCPLQQSE